MTTVDELVARLVELESAPDEVVTPPPPTDLGTALRVGVANSNEIVGMGPATGGYSANASPLFTVYGYDFGIAVADIVDRINKTRAANGILVFAPSRNRNQHMDPITDLFSRTEYESVVRQYEGIPEIQEAVDDGVVHMIIADEFNHPSYNSSADPDDLNWAGNLHKSIWPGVLTSARMGADTLHNGWNGSGVLSSTFWTGLDYGWSQRAGQHNGRTLSAYFADEKARLLSSGLGQIQGLNWWNGGIKVDSEGVKACWDIENDGSSSGFIIGSAGTSGSAFEPGQHVGCGSSIGGITGNPKVVSNPAWIKHWADVVTADPDTPFGILWVYTVDGDIGGAVTAPNILDLPVRSDMVAALKYAINKGLTRTNFNGFRTPKPGAGI